VTALDRISGGRLILGLGRGFRRSLFEVFGIDPASKRDRFDSALDRILEIWRRSPGGDGNGSHAGSGPRDPGRPTGPIQQPHPPLAVAAFGPKGLTQAARRGLPYLASPMEGMDILLENLDFHRSGLPPGIDARDLPTPIMRMVHVARDDPGANRVRDHLAGELRGRIGKGLTPAMTRALAIPVEERVIVGTRNQVFDRLGLLKERSGMDLLIVRPQIRGARKSEQVESLEALAGDIVPCLMA
jgi:alkanesulfonate monooxygenase SsuD/methylene tetrahydromethanopterin reductase-like flavin-dependent oxidoreductase (luciferase family)